MKHKYLSLAVLSLFSGMTMAATSVTLYGTAEIAYRDQTGDNLSLRQDAAGESRLGVKGQEDLGNGTAASSNGIPLDLGHWCQHGYCCWHRLFDEKQSLV